jgi:hypothetical protein
MAPGQPDLFQTAKRLKPREDEPLGSQFKAPMELKKLK